MEVDAPFSSAPAHGRLLLLLLVTAFALLPVYVLPPGGLHVADGPIMLITAYIFVTHSTDEIRIQSTTVITLFLFLFWAVTVNLLHYLIDYRSLCVLASIQVFYTVVLFISFTIFFFRALSDVHAVKYIYFALLLSSIVPLLAGGASPKFLVRQSLSYENPNQLALFSLAIFAAILIVNHFTGAVYPTIRSAGISRLATITAIALAHYYVILSASRAGLVGLAYLDLVAFWKRKKLLFAAVFAVTLLIPAAHSLQPAALKDTMLYKRMIGADFYSKLADRTEGRFSFEDLSFVFGGGKARKSTADKKPIHLKEVHNTLGDIVYSYGLIGGCLFLLFLFFYFRVCSAVRYNFLILLAFLPMHMSHNLIRFRIVWLFYALVYSACLLYPHAIDKENRS